MYLEQELKLSLTEREFNLILMSGKGQTATHTNFYFWVEKLKENQIVRIRKTQEENYFLCLKMKLTNNNGVWVSREYTEEITAGLFQKFIEKGIAKEDISEILKVDFFLDLKYCGCLTTERTVLTVEGLTVELDKSFYQNSIDFELECESTDIEKLENLKNFLISNFSILIRPGEPKSKRFFNALLNGKR